MLEDRKSNERAVRERRLILGGARSGKTAHAISLAKSLSSQRNFDVTYVATAQPLDSSTVPARSVAVGARRRLRPVGGRGETENFIVGLSPVSAGVSRSTYGRLREAVYTCAPGPHL